MTSGTKVAHPLPVERGFLYALWFYAKRLYILLAVGLIFPLTALSLLSYNTQWTTKATIIAIGVIASLVWVIPYLHRMGVEYFVELAGAERSIDRYKRSRDERFAEYLKMLILGTRVFFAEHRLLGILPPSSLRPTKKDRW